MGFNEYPSRANPAGFSGIVVTIEVVLVREQPGIGFMRRYLIDGLFLMEVLPDGLGCLARDDCGQ